MPIYIRALPKLIAALSLSTLAGCAWLPQSDAAGSLRFGGLMQVTTDGARLESCAGPVHELQNDETVRALFDQVAQPGQTAIFVDLRGQLLADHRVRVEEVIRMGSTGRGCSDPVPPANYWVALGEQPAWLAQIGPAGMKVQLDAADGDWLSVITEQLPDGSRGFRAMDGETAELWIYPQPCFARRSGDYYHHTARLLQAGASHAGCAYQGILAGDQPSVH